MIKNILRLLLGSAFAQVIVFSTLPIITRIYNPEDFGLFGTILATSTILSVLSTLRLEYGIMAKPIDDLQRIFSGSTIILICISLCILLLLYIVDNLDLNYDILIVTEYSMGIFFMVISFSFYVIISAVASKLQKYKNLAFSKIVQAALIVSLQVSLAFFFGADIGNLIMAYIVSFIFASIFIIYRSKLYHLLYFDYRDVIYTIKLCREIVFYQTPAAIINAISQNAFTIIMLVLYGPIASGLYALANRILLAPCALIGKSTRDVFIIEASKLATNRPELKKIYLSTVFSLAKIAIPIFLVIAIFSPTLFGVIFGPEWHDSGVLMSILCIWGAALFCNSPATATINIINIQKFSLIYEIIYVVSRVFIVLTMYHMGFDYVACALAFSIVGFMSNVFYINYVYKKI